MSEAPVELRAGGGGPVCRCCGTPLVRRGAFYWHVTPQGRCPVTCWPAATIEGPDDSASADAPPGRPAARRRNG